MCGTLDGDERQRWQLWRGAHPDHERAWQHLEAVSARLRRSQRSDVLRTFAAADAAFTGRREALRTLAVLLGVGGTSVLTTRTRPWQQMTADYGTATGERREFALEDGSRLMLNTASAVNLRFDAHERRIQLVAGEILVETAHALGRAADPRPLIVETAEGRVRALGTRFTVQQQSGRSRVAVLHSAAEIRVAEIAAAPFIVQAGEQAVFSRSGLEVRENCGPETAAWTRGELIADGQRLDAFLGDLNRYRPGLIRCDPAVAALRLSGVFPLDDIDRIFTMLPRVLPVQVRQRSRYWTLVEAAG